ncbi:unnamed protein product [Bursaphelenchus xylophilus]|uniref:(pine wood nematode) hypothetical protein n=1 Tax=Bursaphelenchus xylophilus TaxID=6326 RepID=A0A1I7S1V9_BURXY|nr:unnamed protein product [Bursaphelenchus xylophilus]CAG9090011.1 unnamed protein product [Bursaphelenchus xylophilus]
MEHLYSGSQTLPRQYRSSKIYSSPINVPLLEHVVSTEKCRSTTMDPPLYSEVCGTSEAKEKLRLALHSLGLMCFIAVFFSFVSLNRLDSWEKRALNLTVKSRNDLIFVVWEMSMSVTLAMVLCSLATFFVASIQLFFALKIAKNNVKSPEVALRYLHDARTIRLPTFFMFFICSLTFLISLLVSLLFLPSNYGLIPRGIAGLIGVFLVVFCSLAALHSIHCLLRIETDSNSTMSTPKMTRFPARFSTLV